MCKQKKTLEMPKCNHKQFSKPSVGLHPQVLFGDRLNSDIWVRHRIRESMAKLRRLATNTRPSTEKTEILMDKVGQMDGNDSQMVRIWSDEANGKMNRGRVEMTVELLIKNTSRMGEYLVPSPRNL